MIDVKRIATGAAAAGRRGPAPETLIYWEMQKDLSGSDRLNQQCVSLFGEGLNVADVHLYVKVPHRKLQEEKATVSHAACIVLL